MSRLGKNRKKKIKFRNKINRSYKYALALVIVTFVFVKASTALDLKSIEEDNIAHNIETVRYINCENIMLVNREHELDKEYIPSDLVELNVEFLNNNKNHNLLKKEVAAQVEIMFEDAKKDGIDLLAVSGYRSYEYQQKLYENKVKKTGKYEADKYVAQPGMSEHQTGLAIDILSTEYKNLNNEFKDTQAYRWLCENIDRYGFIIRYKEGKESITGYGFEPWHFRYVGKDLAKELKERDITLEEYYNKNRYDIVNK